MAAGTSLLVCVALLRLRVPRPAAVARAIEGTAGIVVLVAGCSSSVFRSGLNLRFADPSLTTEQVGAAILFLAYIMYHAGPAREALTLFYPVAMLFGVLRLNAARLMVLALLALVGARHGAAPLLPARSRRLDVRRGAHRVRRADDRAAVVRGDGRLRQPAARAPADSNRELKRRLRPHRASSRIRDELTGATTGAS